MCTSISSSSILEIVCDMLILVSNFLCFKYSHVSKLILLKLLLHIQIEDVRLRLNVDVTVTLDSPLAPAPVESFTDMVIFCILHLV